LLGLSEAGDKLEVAPDELAGFKKLAKSYSSVSSVNIATLLRDKELLEICHDD